MNISETAAVLAKIKLGDNREVDNQGLVLREWHETIGDLDYQDCIAAVTMHRQESTDYLQASHIRVNARRVRDAREREARKALPAPAPQRITLDRAKFEAETEAAAAARRVKHASKIDPADWS
jgi:hypothetical protein